MNVVNRNDRRREVTKQKLVSGAVELFVAKGYSNTTIDEICAAADVAKVTFYYHFQSKEDIVTQIKSEASSEVLAEAREQLAAQASATEVLQTTLGSIAKWTKENWRLLEVFLAQKFHNVTMPPKCEDSNSLLSLLELIVIHGVTTGEFRTTADPKEIASFIALAIWHQQMTWVSNQQTTNLTEDFSRTLEFILKGISV